MKPELSVYYDGACHICSREIFAYAKRDRHQKIRFVDIAHNSFDPIKEGLDPQAIQRAMHVKDQAGQIYTGIEAFIQMWKVLPNMSWAAKLAKLPILNPTLKFFYHVFAEHIRPKLPKRKVDCSSGTCELKR